MLISAVPHCAPPTTLRIYYQTTRPICPICGALLKATEMGPQRSHVRPTCAAQAQVLSLSSKRCRSASRARPQPMVRSPNDRRLHLSPHHRPSVTMAAVGRMAASTRARRRLLRVYLSEISLGQVPPRAPRPTSTWRASFRVASRCAAATKARTQRPSCPASLRPRADRYPPQPSQVARSSPPSSPTAAARRSEIGGCAWARCRACCRRLEPLCRPPRISERGALRHAWAGHRGCRADMIGGCEWGGLAKGA